MESKCALTDLMTDGATLLPCELRLENFRLVVKLSKLNMELSVPIEDISVVIADELHG